MEGLLPELLELVLRYTSAGTSFYETTLQSNDSYEDHREDMEDMDSSAMMLARTSKTMLKKVFKVYTFVTSKYLRIWCRAHSLRMLNLFLTGPSLCLDRWFNANANSSLLSLALDEKWEEGYQTLLDKWKVVGMRSGAYKAYYIAVGPSLRECTVVDVGCKEALGFQTGWNAICAIPDDVQYLLDLFEIPGMKIVKTSPHLLFQLARIRNGDCVKYLFDHGYPFEENEKVSTLLAVAGLSNRNLNDLMNATINSKFLSDHPEIKKTRILDAFRDCSKSSFLLLRRYVMRLYPEEKINKQQDLVRACSLGGIGILSTLLSEEDADPNPVLYSMIHELECRGRTTEETGYLSLILNHKKVTEESRQKLFQKIMQDPDEEDEEADMNEGREETRVTLKALGFLQ